MTKLLDIGFMDLKSNISALTEAKGNLNQAIDLLIAESRKPVTFSIPMTTTPHSLSDNPDRISERFILERTRALQDKAKEMEIKLQNDEIMRELEKVEQERESLRRRNEMIEMEKELRREKL